MPNTLGFGGLFRCRNAVRSNCGVPILLSDPAGLAGSGLGERWSCFGGDGGGDAVEVSFRGLGGLLPPPPHSVARNSRSW
jgi:hypothetical protein